MSSTILPERILRLMSVDDRRSLGKAGITKAEVLEKAAVKSERNLQNLIDSYYVSAVLSRFVRV